MFSPPSYGGKGYIWLGSVESVSLASQARHVLYIPPYTLVAGKKYTFRFKGAMRNSTMLANSAMVNVHVLPTPLVVKVQGGFAQSFALNASVVLNASASYDPDLAPGTADPNITYAWNCKACAPRAAA